MAPHPTDLESLRASWAQHERQVYTLALSDPALYQRALLAARALADGLRSVASIEQLTARWPEATTLLADAQTRHGLATAGLPPEHVAAAGFALREREIGVLAQRQVLGSRIDAGLQAGASWLVLHESGAIDSGLSNPYCCTEMHLASGWAVVCEAQPDPIHATTAVFTVDLAKLDRETGDVLDRLAGVDRWSESTTSADFELARAAARLHIEARSRPWE